MSRAIITTILLFVSLVSRMAAEDAPESDLIRGFAENDKTPLRAFAKQWHAQSKVVPPEIMDKKPRIEQAAYRVFQSFFRPASFYKDTEYVIVQDQIEVIVLDDSLNQVFSRSPASRRAHLQLEKLPVISRLIIKDFRPGDLQTPKKVLYLGEDHVADLLLFLHGTHVSPAERDTVKSASDEHRLRADYLDPILYILPGHWGQGWHFETHPHVHAIEFNPDLSRAVVRFREHYGGGHALLELKQDEWVLAEKQYTWIE